MFGRHYFGAHYFPPIYFGEGGGLLVVFLNDASDVDDGERRKSRRFYIRNATMMRVTAINGNTIRRLADVTSPDGYIECDVVGSFLELSALSDTEWVTTEEYPEGGWTVSP